MIDRTITVQPTEAPIDGECDETNFAVDIIEMWP